MAAKKKQDADAPATGLPALVGDADQAGLALDQLTQALAGMLGAGDDPYEAAPEGSTADADPLPVESDGARCEISPRSILEAMLFVGSPSGELLTGRKVASLMRGVRPAEIDAAVRELNADYQRRNCPYLIMEEAGGYRMALRPEYDRLREKFFGRTRQAKLSQAAIEVLAVVAYNEPVTSEEIARLRGTGSGHILAQLVRRQLLRLERTNERPRKTVYWTTERFLKLFGLESLDDLPRSQEAE